MRAFLAAVSLCIAVAAITARSANPRFFPDDPLWTDDDTLLDASKVVPQEDSNFYDFVLNQFGNPGERSNVKALNVNTLDEVPDSMWFTNRIGRKDIPTAQLVRGPDSFPPPISIDNWMISRDKGGGVQPGFRMVTPTGETYQIEVDPPSQPEMATGAEVIGTAFYYAFGYHTVEVYLSELDPRDVLISQRATIRDPYSARRRPFTHRDLDNLLQRAAKQPNGKYRVIASRFAKGRPLGNFRYYGTRPDDPNDVVPHEHRRELRGARVFAAWLNHDDSRGVNSLDFLETLDKKNYIRHYMFDFGSILGSGTVYSQRHRPGNEYIYESAPGWKTLATFGLYLRPWMLIDYPDDMPAAVGRFEGDAFDPLKWKPEYPNPAFENMRPDDAFWAALIVSKFSDAAVRAIVEKAKFTDREATDYMTTTLIKRRDKVLTTWLNVVNPVVDPVLSATGELTFDNAAVTAKAAEPPASYALQWFRFDNASDKRDNVGSAETVTSARAQAPAALTGQGGGEYIGVAITAKHPTYAAWAKPATFYFRRGANGWTWVGAERD
jgi:hypothetical protein